jgi:hypothetical protein
MLAYFERTRTHVKCDHFFKPLFRIRNGRFSSRQTVPDLR